MKIALACALALCAAVAAIGCGGDPDQDPASADPTTGYPEMHYPPNDDSVDPGGGQGVNGGGDPKCWAADCNQHAIPCAGGDCQDPINQLKDGIPPNDHPNWNGVRNPAPVTAPVAR